MDIPGLIAFILFIVAFFYLVFDSIRLRIKNHGLRKGLAQEIIDKMIIAKELERKLIEDESKKLEQSEGFVRFISESRDWAFQYIEDFQTALVEYDLALSVDDAVALNAAYKKLMDMLPSDAISPDS
jgi:hypothetical protein